LDSDYREAIKQGINIIKEVDIPIHLLTLSWSCGRFDIKKGKSDIDFFIVVNSKAEAEDLKIKIDNHRLINSIKIWYTIIDKNSFENLGENVDMKIYYLIKNINTLLSPILIKSDIKIPIYHKDELIQSVQKQILSYVQSIQQALYSSIDIKHLLIEHKHTYTVMKLLLLIKWYDQVEWYSAVYNTFYKIFWNTFPHIPKRSFLEDNEFEFKDVKENLSSFIEKVLWQLRLDNDVK
jgi:hypothetical protein